MQNLVISNETMGEILLKLSNAKEGEKKNLLKVLEDKIITKYPNEEKILQLMIREACKGKTKVTLWNGVLAPDFAGEKISTKVIDNHSVIAWNE